VQVNFPKGARLGQRRRRRRLQLLRSGLSRGDTRPHLAAVRAVTEENPTDLLREQEERSIPRILVDPSRTYPAPSILPTLIPFLPFTGPRFIEDSLPVLPYSAFNPPPHQISYPKCSPTFFRSALSLEAFEKIGASDEVLQLVSGTRIPELDSAPSLRGKKNGRSALAHSDLMTDMLTKLNEAGVLCWPLPPDSPRPKFVEPLDLVPKATGKPRLVYNQQRGNEYINKRPCYFKGIDFTLGLCRPGCWFTRLDLESAFWSLPIDPAFRTYFGFCWKGKWGWWSTMPFGMRCSPFFFTRVMSTVASYLRRTYGIWLHYYMDDWLLIGRSVDESRSITKIAIAAFTKLGFRVNAEKSVTEPTQTIDWLGHVINSRDCSVQISEHLAKSITSSLDISGASASLPVETVASILGKLSACSLAQPVVLSYVRPWQQYLQRCTTNGHARAVMNLECLRRAAHVGLRPRYWDRDLGRYSDVYTDASNTGLGYVFSDGQFGSWRWSSVSKDWHINCLELLAALVAIESAIAHGYRELTLYCDNTAVISWIRKRRTPDDFLNIWFRQWIFRWQALRVFITPVYIPSELNPADYYSRL
jgi:hypothetical protein